MRRYIYILLSLILPFSALSQNISMVYTEAEKVLCLIDKFHIQPKPVDDSLSVYVYRELLKTIHEEGVYLLQSEVDQLAVFKFTIDDELLADSEWRFFPMADSVYQVGMKRMKRFTEELAGTACKFNETETYHSVRYSIQYFANEEELKNQVRLRIKYAVLDELIDYALENEISDLSKLNKQEDEARKKITDEELKSLEYYLDPDNKILSYYFLNILSEYFDPHSNYFSLNQKEYFEDELSSEDFRFGISLSVDDEGHAIIDQLEPGGAAWKSNKLNKGDRLLKLQWEGEKTIDVSEMSLEEIHEILQQGDRQILIFTVKKANGSKKTVKVRKEMAQTNDELVKSYILNGEKKIGYIALPDFYSGYSGSVSGGCANDVAKEILKLQKENIEGIVLDIRNNGGGFLREALNLAGIFISEGPLGIDKMREGKPITLKDENRGTVFKGPLIIMINGQSASASEVLAASLQDYHRAVIAGQRSFGKATSQVVFPLDTSITLMKMALNAYKETPSYLKITIGKLYRLNGSTNQKRGVIPDIELPDIYNGLYNREDHYSTAIGPDSIYKKMYFTPLAPLPVSELKNNLNERMQSDTLFQPFLVRRDSLVKITGEFKKGFELTLEAHYKLITAINGFTEEVEANKEASNTFFTIENHAYEEKILDMDSYYWELNNEVMNDLSGDPEIIEVYFIMKDLINLTKN